MVQQICLFHTILRRKERTQLHTGLLQGAPHRQQRARQRRRGGGVIRDQANAQPVDLLSYCHTAVPMFLAFFDQHDGDAVANGVFIAVARVV